MQVMNTNEAFGIFRSLFLALAKHTRLACVTAYLGEENNKQRNKQNALD